MSMKKPLLLLACVLLASSAALANSFTYTALLSGAAETPSNASAATGFATVIYDSSAHTLDVSVSFAGLNAPATAAHIHCCVPASGNAGVANVFSGFPNTTSGSFNQTLDLTSVSSWNAAFVTASGSIAGAEAALANGLNLGETYFNIHDAIFPGGEIRGFLTLAPTSTVPEPATLTLLSAGLVSLAGFRRKWRQGSPS